ncbi:hypothetical protein AMOR_39460 [Anaeromyxobacter oryzae]|uniref:Stereocilin n=1 Tax=Anaeromyxobacter oryzae TaxID=2918170 RepID=A0ABM7WZP4_9BACT|nr:hypothetical protein AMOR_39460 [Anaeromyxobacter oryzae]
MTDREIENDSPAAAPPEPEPQPVPEPVETVPPAFDATQTLG